MKIREKLEALRNYFEVTRRVGHTTLLKEGTNNYNKDKLVLAYKKEDYGNLNCKPSEIISWRNLDGLNGRKKPLAIDNGVMWLMLKEAVEYIDELEMYKKRLTEIERIFEIK
jgi:hypothetical protein